LRRRADPPTEAGRARRPAGIAETADFNDVEREQQEVFAVK
jgi:hypothetical protein